VQRGEEDAEGQACGTVREVTVSFEAVVIICLHSCEATAQTELQSLGDELLSLTLRLLALR
jgi:hypothetical protein